MVDWISIAMQKVWEGFWTAVGGGIAVALGIATGLVNKGLSFINAHWKNFNGKLTDLDKFFGGKNP